MSLLVFFCCSCNGPHCCHGYNQSLCCLLPFYRSHMYSCMSLFQSHVTCQTVPFQIVGTVKMS